MLKLGFEASDQTLLALSKPLHVTEISAANGIPFGAIERAQFPLSLFERHQELLDFACQF